MSWQKRGLWEKTSIRQPGRLKNAPDLTYFLSYDFAILLLFLAIFPGFNVFFCPGESVDLTCFVVLVTVVFESRFCLLLWLVLLSRLFQGKIPFRAYIMWLLSFHARFHWVTFSCWLESFCIVVFVAGFRNPWWLFRMTNFSLERLCWVCCQSCCFLRAGFALRLAHSFLCWIQCSD